MVSMFCTSMAASAAEVINKSVKAELTAQPVKYRDPMYFKADHIPYGDVLYSVYDSEISIDGFADGVDTVEIPNEINGLPVTSINVYYESANKVSKLIIPESVTEISFLHGLHELSEIEVDENNPNFSSLDGVLFNKNKEVIRFYPEARKDSTYSIPDGVKTIGEDAFFNCKNLTGVTIPYGVQFIRDYAFAACTNLSDIHIPYSVISIDEGAFQDCESINEFAISSKIVAIDDYTFLGCSSLSKVYMPQSTIIEYLAFEDDIAFIEIDDLGDIDSDSEITSADALLALRYSVKIESFTEKQQILANVDGDSEITSADSLIILRQSVGLE